ncbi:MAG: hypothetical protein PGN33_11275 [Methylobacterium radiotolerans]
MTRVGGLAAAGSAEYRPMPAAPRGGQRADHEPDPVGRVLRLIAQAGLVPGQVRRRARVDRERLDLIVGVGSLDAGQIVVERDEPRLAGENLAGDLAGEPVRHGAAGHEPVADGQRG